MLSVSPCALECWREHGALQSCPPRHTLLGIKGAAGVFLERLHQTLDDHRHTRAAAYHLHTADLLKAQPSVLHSLHNKQFRKNILRKSSIQAWYRSSQNICCNQRNTSNQFVAKVWERGSYTIAFLTHYRCHFQGRFAAGSTSNQSKRGMHD